MRTLVARLRDHGVDASALYFCESRDGAADGRFLDRKAQHDPRIVADLWRELRTWSRCVESDRVPCAEARRGPPNTPIVHTHLGWPLYFVRVASLGLRVARVHTEHSTGNVRRTPVLRPVERWMYGGLDALYCVSEAARDSLAAWLAPVAPPMAVIWNGARALRPRQRDAPRGCARLISVGSLTHHKGIDLAIDAVARARDHVEAYRVVGDGPERAALMARARTLGVADLVEFVGWSDDVERHLHWAHALVMPSRREGFGLAAVEALSTGLPVIAARVPGVTEVLHGAGDAARLVAAGDVDALAAALRGLAVQAPDDYEALHALAVRQAARFGEDAMVAAYAAHYRTLARAQSSRSSGAARG